MKSPEELRFESTLKIRDLCITYEDILILIAEYPPLKLALDNHILKIYDARELNMADLSNLFANKDVVQEAVVAVIFKYMLRAAVKASAIGNTELEISLDHPLSYFTECDDATVEVRCEATKKIMKTNILLLTNILPANITEMEAAILAYHNALLSPEEAIEKRKTQGTELITSLLNNTEPTRNNIGKLFHSYIPEAASLFDAAALTGKSTGIRHTSIALQIHDSLAIMPLKGIKVTATNGTEIITKYTTDRGWVRLYSLPNALWNITIEYPNYITQHLPNIPSIDSKMTLLNIKLVKIQPPPPSEEDTPPVSTPPPTDENPSQLNT